MGSWEELLPQLPLTHMWTAHNSHLICIIAVARALANAGVWASRTTDYQGLCHFLGYTEGQAGSGAVAASGFSSFQMGWCLSEWNLFSTDPMPVDKMGTVKYALTSPPATTASHIQVDFSVSSEG